MCCYRYDSEAAYFDSNTRETMRVDLLARLYAVLKPVYCQQATFHRDIVLKEFERELRMASSEALEPFAPLAARVLASKESAFRAVFEEHVFMAGRWQRAGVKVV